MEFKQECPDIVMRKKEFNKISFAHPNMLPLIIEPFNTKVVLSNNKFLVPKAYSFQEFQFSIRKKLKLSKNRLLYFLVNEKHVVSPEKSMLAVYKEFKDTDGFLYVKYSVESSFG